VYSFLKNLRSVFWRVLQVLLTFFGDCFSRSPHAWRKPFLEFPGSLIHMIARWSLRVSGECDLFFGSGTAKVVYAAAMLPEIALRHGATGP
jgi:hypothetical protein